MTIGLTRIRWRVDGWQTQGDREYPIEPLEPCLDLDEASAHAVARRFVAGQPYPDRLPEDYRRRRAVVVRVEETPIAEYTSEPQP